jgi:YVTN family beta-propeller protein
MKFSKLVFVAFVSAVFFVSCTDDNDQVEVPLGAYDNGVLILNEGGFGKGNASVSYLSDDFITQQNNIFSLVNPAVILGDTAQNIGFYGDLAFIVLNGSNKIEVVNRYTMKQVATIKTGLINPRYIAFSNGKGFVTNWGDGGNTADDFVAVVNLSNYTVSSTITVIEGPEMIVANNSKLYIAHKGGYGYGNTISVIDAAVNKVLTKVTVGDVPNSLEVSDGSLYVLCGGKPSYSKAETAGSFVKLNLSNNTVSSTISFPDKTHPSNLDVVDSNIFYTVGSDIFKSTLSATTLPSSKLFSTTAQGVYGVYSFAVNNNKIYVGDAGDYSSNGKVYVYSSTGAIEKTYTVGVIPAGFYFN